MRFAILDVCERGTACHIQGRTWSMPAEMAAEVQRWNGEVNLPNIISPTPCSHQQAVKDIFFLMGLPAARQKKLLQKSRPHFSQLSRSVKELVDALICHPYGFRSFWCLHERRERSLQGVKDVVEAADAMRASLVSGRKIKLPSGRPAKMNCRYMYEEDRSMADMDILSGAHAFIAEIYSDLRCIKAGISPPHRIKLANKHFYRHVTYRSRITYHSLIGIAETAENIKTLLEANPDWCETDIGWALIKTKRSPPDI